MVGIQLSLFGKMSPEHSLVIMDTIFKPCLKKSQKPIFQCLQVGDGQTQEWFEGGQYAPLGDCLTLNIGESPNEESVSTLSEVLEAIVPKKYYLSRTACDGILRRAERRGRVLDDVLMQALKEANSFLMGGGNGNGQIAPTMTGDHNNRITDYSAIVLQSFGFHGWNSVTAAGVELRKEQAPTLTAKKQADALVKTVVCLNDQDGNSIAVESGHVSPTLRAEMHGNLPIVAYGFPLGFRPENTRLYKDKATTICNGTRPGFCNGVVIGIDTYNQANTGDKAKTLLAGHQDADGLPCVVYAIDRAAFNQGENALYDFEISKSGISSTLVAKGLSAVAYALQGSMFGREDQNEPNGSGVNKDVCFTLNTADRHGVAYEMTVENFVHWCVRRLTPKECERLQGYPDFWTVLRKIESMTDEEYDFYKSAYITDKEIKGKAVKRAPTKEQLIAWHNKLDVDGTRYRQLGNSLAIPCALRVIGYIADYIREGVKQDERQ